jgi:hypothetical protein
MQRGEATSDCGLVNICLWFIWAWVGGSSYKSPGVKCRIHLTISSIIHNFCFYMRDN